MRRVFFFITSILVTSSILGMNSSWAEMRLITDVLVKGNKIVSQEMILSKVKTRIGAEFDEGVLNQDIKRLYAAGYFTDVEVELADYEEGLRVTFVVEEKPKLVNIIIEGASALKEPQIEAEVFSRVGSILDRKKLKEDANRIRRLYESKGYHLAKVEYEVDVDPETKEATAHILIEEGPSTRIKGIYISGNRTFPDKQILKLIKTRRDTLFTSGFFKEDTFDEDLERIRAFYRNAGFADVKVDYELKYGPERQRMYITLYIDEGKRYLAGSIGIAGYVLFPEEDIRKSLKMREGDVFSQYNLRQDMVRIQRFYFERGYISAEVEAETALNEATHAVDVVYNIVENELAYVDKVRVRGNTKTKDEVIRRELRIVPGEPFHGGKLQRSKERLYNLGYFEEVTYDIEPGVSPDRKELVITVKETKTGEFSFGAGYSSLDQFVGFVQITQKNFDLFNFPAFTGGGQSLGLRAEFGTVRQNFDLSFTEPWLFGRPLLFGVDGYNRTYELDDYDEERRGGDIRLGKDLTEYVRANLMYKLEDVEVFDIADEASSDVWDEEGTSRKSSLTLGLTCDTRDSIFSPTRGTVLNWTGEYAGGALGGDKDFYKMRGLISAYFTPIERLTLELKLRAGVTEEFDDSTTVPLYERFYAGGATTIRGYDERMVGPIDPESAEPIGGKTMLIGNIEFTFPIIEVIKGAVFYDIGNVWYDSYDFDLDDLSSGAGVGIRIKTPIGPVRLDYGYGLDYRDTDKDQNGMFYFSISRGF